MAISVSRITGRQEQISQLLMGHLTAEQCIGCLKIMEYQVFWLYFLKLSLFFCFLGPNPQHMEVPRLGVKSDLQLLAYTIATAVQDPSLICDLHHSSQQCRILNQLSERGQGSNLKPHSFSSHLFLLCQDRNSLGVLAITL